VVIDTPHLKIASNFDGDGELIFLGLIQLETEWRNKIPSIGTIEISSQETPKIEARSSPNREISIPTTSPPVLILHANGTNRDRDAFVACELAGSEPEIVHVNQLLAGERQLLDYHMLVVPGGFSYGDDLGAGTLWALDLQNRLGEDVRRFIDEGRPVLGICNGFQALVKSGLLPGALPSPQTPRPEGEGLQKDRTVTLTFNESGHFECRWVYLQPNPNSPCLFTQGLTEPIYCPVAHGEGRVAVADQAALDSLWSSGLAALIYTDASGKPAGYPENPNGSAYNIAGLCNAAGNVFGLMPHPEDHIFRWQHPRWRRGEGGMDGLRLFQNGVRYA
jgi:phosphoribosylformylglycinamidine synthase